MHGSSPGLAVLLDTEVAYMGGIVENGVGSDTKTSPRRAAIEKAQEELRQEYDVREERRRELEFLEKGGNPLDFKFGQGASISLQSTSLTDQLAEHYVISEAKGSFALAPSPHGDSVESSGRPGGSVSREPNTADNLLLLDGESLDGLKNVKPPGKRGNAVAFEQSSPLDGGYIAKESDDSAVFRLGAKSQAYARRNRSRSVRDGSNAGSADLIHGGNRSSVVPSSRSNAKNVKGLLRDAQADDHVTFISNSKPASPNGNVVSRTSPSADQVDMEVDGIQTLQTPKEATRDGLPECAIDFNPSLHLQGHEPANQDAHYSTDQALNVTAHSSDAIVKGAVPVGLALVPPGNTKDNHSAGIVSGISVPDKSAVEAQDCVPSGKSHVAAVATEELSLNDTNLSHIESRPAADGIIKDDKCLLRTDSKPDRNHGDPLVLCTHAKPIESGLGEKSEQISVGRHDALSDEHRSAIAHPCNPEMKGGLDLGASKCDRTNEVGPLSNIVNSDLNGEVAPDNENNTDTLLGDGSSTDRNDHVIAGGVSSSCLPSNPNICTKGSFTEVENGVVNQSKSSKKAHEDAILKEARIIEANIKRAGELSISTIFSEKQKKCHWDYVLEEMSWMANDFMQERAWKITAASKVSCCIASGGLSKFWSENMYRNKPQHIARTLAKAIMHFWHSAEVICTSNMVPKDIREGCVPNLPNSTNVDGVKLDKDQDSEFTKESSAQIPLPVQDYAVRFLKYTSSMPDHPMLPEAPTTPERMYDTGILEMSWEDHLSEENLFYNVPSGAMQAYRESIESLWLRDKKSSNSMHQEDCEASVCDSVADVHHENTYEEDEGETGTYILPGAIESGGSSKFDLKKRKIFQQKSYGTKLYEMGANLSGEPCLESRVGNQPLTVTGKRPSGALNVGSIPTKRMRTAARQRFVSPFSTTPTGGIQLTSKTDVSSGDTSSYQDEQSSLHAGSQCRKNLEVESTMDYDRQLPYDNSEISTKPKKKKKPKHLGYKNSLNLANPNVLVVPGKGFSYEQRLQIDPIMQHEQNVKKRVENPHFESNGSTGLYIQHAAKKPKLLKQLPDTSSDAIAPMAGSITSPVASQMSNMSNTNKLIKIVANRDRGRKNKTMKMTTGQSGSRNPWAAFEDQALVVLVHDLGPNWELVSDAINSTLQFKLHYIFRKPKECKERHKALMDRSAGDGADSAEDSGSSQPYPSTLPGIPKGSARQLFQRLQGPMEEDTLKVHFEKIILIRQQRHSCRSQNDNQEMKQIVPAHNSHVVALSQVIPNNLSGGILTPLDLCDSITSSPDVTALGYQGSHTSGLAIPSHPGSVAPVLPATSANSVLQTSAGMVIGSGLPSPSNPLSAASRDAQRYGMPRSVSLPVDEQQRMQYTQMLSGRNVQQSGLPVPGNLPVAVDRGVRMLPGSGAMGMMCGMNRGMPMPRAGFQGINSPGMLNMVSTSAMLSGNGVGMPNPVTAHQGNSMLRPHDTLHMLRPGQNTEEQRQMLQELQMQVSQGNGQAVSTFNGMSGPFSNASVSPPVQTFPVHQHQQSHLLGNPHSHIQGSNHSSPQQQAYAIRYAKERQLQQRILPQPQASFPSSNAISPIQNSSQIQQQTQSSVPVGSSAPGQQKQQQMPRNPQPGCGMPNQVMKQRQRPQVHQQPRNLQQQRQQQQPPQQQAKLMKGLGRGAMMMHQNLPVDASHVNGLTSASKNQVPEKHLMQQGQGFYPGNSGLNPSVSQQPGQPKIFSRPLPQSSKQISPVPSQSESSNQGQVQVSSTHNLLAPQQPPAQSSLPLPAQPPVQQQQQQQRQTNHSKQTLQRMVLPQNRLTSDSQIQSSSDPVQGNQVVSSASVVQCTDSVNSAPVASSATQWKTEPSHDTNTLPSSAHLDSSPQENLVANDTVAPPSSQTSSQRQFSGGVSMHGHGIGGQWQQQQQPQSQQPQPPQNQHRQTAQTNLYAQSSNSGPG